MDPCPSWKRKIPEWFRRVGRLVHFFPAGESRELRGTGDLLVRDGDIVPVETEKVFASRLENGVGELVALAFLVGELDNHPPATRLEAVELVTADLIARVPWLAPKSQIRERQRRNGHCCCKQSYSWDRDW